MLRRPCSRASLLDCALGLALGLCAWCTEAISITCLIVHEVRSGKLDVKVANGGRQSRFRMQQRSSLDRKERSIDILT